MDWLVVGAGFTGSVLAERLAAVLGDSVLVIDRRAHIGGNAHDSVDDDGILIHKYGPHIFHTNADRVWSYLGRFTTWHEYEHRVLAEVDGILVPLPFNLNAIDLAFGPRRGKHIGNELAREYPLGSRVPVLKLRQSSSPTVRRLADYVYERVFLNYTLKQWGVGPEQLDSSVTARVPIRVSRDDRYFEDRYQGIPTDGYTKLFERMLDHPKIAIMTQTDYMDIRNQAGAERIIYTGPIDEYFDFRYGPLPYRSLRFELQHHHLDWFQPTGTINYPQRDGLTRISEFKRMTGQKHTGTTVVSEFPGSHEPGLTEPYYPIPMPSNMELHARYARDASLAGNRIIFAGRLATYRYLNMDQAVGQALSIFSRIATSRGIAPPGTVGRQQDG